MDNYSHFYYETNTTLPNSEIREGKKMNNYFFVGIVVVIISFNIVLAFVRRKGITFSVYAADPNKHGIWAITMTLTGTIVGGGMFLAVGQIGYEAGTAGFVLGLVYFVGLFIVGAFAHKIREIMDKGNHETLIDILRHYYNDKVVSQFCIINLAMYTFLLAGQFVAMFQFVQFVQKAAGIALIPWALVGLAVLSLFLYPIIGGLRKDIQTDIIQVIIIIAASIPILVNIICSGIWKSLWVNLPDSHVTGTGYGWLFIVGAILFLTPSFLTRMDIWQRIRTAKTEKDSIYGFWFAGGLSCFFFFLFTTIGMWAYSLKFTNSKFATLDLIYQQFQNPWILGLIIGAFFAAVLSSADTFINNISLFITRVTFPNLWNQKGNEQTGKTLLVRSRIFAFAFICISIVLGRIVPNFVDLLVGAFSLLLIYLPTIFGLLIVESWRNPKAAFWSSNLGVLAFLFFFFCWNPKLAFAPAVLISFITFALILVVTKKK